jgi:hypothetical protein
VGAGLGGHTPLSKGKVPSFPWLSLAGCFQRQWSSLYDAVEQGVQDVTGLSQFLMGQVPTTGVQFWSLDATAWPRSQADTLPDRSYVYAPGRSFKGKPVVPGYSYSLLDWVPEMGESWGEPVEELELEDPKWGRVRLRRWSNLHARKAADVEFDVVQVHVHLEHDHPPPLVWLLWLPPDRIPPTLTLTVETIWHAYAHR